MLRRTARKAFGVDTGEPPPAAFPLTQEGGGTSSAREQAVQRLFDGLVEAIRSQVKPRRVEREGDAREESARLRVSGPRPGRRGPELVLEGARCQVRLTNTLTGFLVVEQDAGGEGPGVELLSVERQGGEYRPFRKRLGISSHCPDGTTAKTPFCFTSVPDLVREYVRVAGE